MPNISFITNTATTIFSIIVYQLLTTLNIGNSTIERGLYVFVCWFFVFIICLFLYSKLPERVGPYISNFSFSLMIDGILILVGTLLVSWTIPLFSPSMQYDAPIAYFSIYYFVFVSIIKLLSQKQYLMTITKIGLSVLFILIVANILPLPDSFQPYTFVLTGVDAMLLIGTLLYYFLNRMLSEMHPQGSTKLG